MELGAPASVIAVSKRGALMELGAPATVHFKVSG